MSLHDVAELKEDKEKGGLQKANKRLTCDMIHEIKHRHASLFPKLGYQSKLIVLTQHPLKLLRKRPLVRI